MQEGRHARYAAIMRSVSPASSGVRVMPQLAVREHVRAVGERDRALRALLDEQDGDAALADRARASSKTTSTIVGASPSDGSSSSSRSGSRDERARDRELLLLAARERAGAAACGTRASDREELVDGVERRRAPSRVAPRGEAEPEVLLDREVGEDAPALGHERDARRGRSAPARARASERPAERARRPPRGGTSP